MRSPATPSRRWASLFGNRRSPPSSATSPAWFIEGSASTWAIFVHGKGETREQALRLIPLLHALGFPTLVITYRNDEGAPEDPDALYRYGAAEFQDLGGAVQHALNNGARRVVLIGHGMGGAIVMSFLDRSLFASRVPGVILDAPLLDFEAVVDDYDSDRVAAWPLDAAGKAIAAERFGIDWDELDYLERVGDLQTPILLFHGTADDETPISTSDQLAELRPDIVTYVRVEGAGHARSWNTNPAAYEQAVQEFLQEVVE